MNNLQAIHERGNPTGGRTSYHSGRWPIFAIVGLLLGAGCRFESQPIEPERGDATPRGGAVLAKPESTKTEPVEAAPAPASDQEAAAPTSEGKAPTEAPAPPPAKAKMAPSDGRPVVITFDDLALDMPADTQFTPSLLTDRVKELDGRRVSIKGFIYAAGIFQQTGITSFPLVKNTQCKFGPGGQAFCVILVRLKEGTTTDFTLRPITVEGTLKVEPYQGPDGNTWSVYSMVGDRVVGG